LTQSIVDQNGGEWLVLDFQTADGADVAGNQNPHWEIDEDHIRLVKSSNWPETYFDWGIDGVLVNPTTNSFPEPGLRLGTNPITGSGTVWLHTINMSDILSLHDSIFLTPFSSLGESGIDPADVSEFQNGLFMSPIPEPSALALFFSGLAALGFFVRRGRSRHA